MFLKLLKILLTSITVVALSICLLFGYRDKTVDELKHKYAQSPSAFVETDNLNVHYRDEGVTTDSLPIVLLHGTGASLHTFDAWTMGLKNQKRVVRMDLPAFGLTGPFPDGDYTMTHYVAFIQHFLIKKGIKRCIIGGNSLGGQIAWQFTTRYPDMVEKLVLIDAAGYPTQSKSTPIAFQLARKPFFNKIMTFITPRFIAKSSLDNVYVDKTKVTDALIDRYFDLTLRAGNRQAFVDRMTTVIDSSRLPLIRTIQQKTLVLWGEQDMLIPLSNGARFHLDLPNDTLVVIPNAGHVPMEERPVESLAALRAFLKIL
jgi:pimeloyl-ACP methyl ester carboxylesterase